MGKKYYKICGFIFMLQVSVLNYGQTVDSNCVEIPLFNRNVSRSEIEENNLNFLYFLNKRSEIIGKCSSHNIKGGSVEKWNISNGERSSLLYLGDNVWIAQMAISPNEEYIVIATMGKEPTYLKCYSLIEEKFIWEIEELDYFGCLGFTNRNKNVIAFGNNGMYVIDSKTGDIVDEIDEIHDQYSLSSNKSTSYYFSPSGKYLVIWQIQEVWSLFDLFRSSANKNITIWDINKRKVIASMLLPEESYRTATFTNDEKHVFLGGGDGFVSLWSLRENKIIKKIKSEAIYLISSKEQNILASGVQSDDWLSDWYFDARFWKYPEMELIVTMKPFARNFTNKGIMPINFDETGNFCAIERGGTLYLYDTKNWEILWCKDTDME